MLSENKLQQLKNLLAQFSREEIIWTSGYLSGQINNLSGEGNSSETIAITHAQANVSEIKVGLIYATETGNAKALAIKLANEAKAKGFKMKPENADTFKVNKLTKNEYVIFITSTQGDGEPPLGAKEFFKQIADADLNLTGLKYGVLALGDTSYPLFCEAGVELDKQLSLRGAERFFPLVKCDTDYESVATQWFHESLDKLSTGGTATVSVAAKAKETVSSGKKNYSGKIITNVNLNDKDSSKETFHIEIEADGVTFEPGDALGLIPENDANLVDKIIDLVQINQSLNLFWREQKVSVYELLRKKASITFLPERIIEKYAAIVQIDIPGERIDLLDLLEKYPVANIEEFLNVLEILEPIAPRLYSISSSIEAFPDEVHLIVAKNKFTINGVEKIGVGSGYLSQLKEEDEINFYIHKNKLFKLPEENKDIIMIGPGTGVAPFRSFLQEREAQGATGRNWLFFGDQHFTSDFLYQTDIQSFLEMGTLTKFNGAFSRDQAHKIYVQHKMQQHGKELFEWIENGAYIYICGNKDPMSSDVYNTLVEIVAENKNTDESFAKNYIDNLKEEGRLVLDVY